MSTTNSSRRWLERQKKDPYVLQARREGYRSRAAYKLLQIQEKYTLLQPGMRVLELGSAPGSWTQLIREWVGQQGKVFAVDLLEMAPIDGVDFMQEDIESDVFLRWCDAQGSKGFDMIVSDMAPNMCGHQSTDRLRCERLVDVVYEICENYLAQEGCFLVKAFHGGGFNDLLKELRLTFKQVKVVKPEASRKASGEVYLLGIHKLTAGHQTG